MKRIITIILLLFPWNFWLNAQTLDDYFHLAAENNPGLKAKYIEFEVALQQVPQVSALPDPTLSFGAFISPVETRVGPQRAKLSLTQMFPWFGTLEAKKDVAALRAEAKYQAFLDARNKLFYKVAAAYFPLYELNQLQKAEKENIELLQSYQNIAIAKFENGKGEMADVLRVDIMLQEATTNLEILGKKEKPLRTQFNQLLNREANTEITVPDSIDYKMSPEDFRRDSLLANNPVLNSYNLKIEASEAAEQVARKKGFPNFGIGLDYAIVGKRADVSLADNGKDILMPMVSVTIPVFRKKVEAAEKEAQLQQQNYALQKQEYSNTLIASYDNALFKMQQQQMLIEQYNKQWQTSRQTLNLLFAAYSNSGKDFEEVLRIQQKILQYKKMIASAITQSRIYEAELDYLNAKTMNYEEK